MKGKKRYSFEEFILTMEMENVVGFLIYKAKELAVSCYLDARRYYEENKEKLSRYLPQLDELGKILEVKL